MRFCALSVPPGVVFGTSGTELYCCLAQCRPGRIKRRAVLRKPSTRLAPVTSELGQMRLINDRRQGAAGTVCLR